MKTISISNVVTCHQCPVRFYLEREEVETMVESERYTLAKQLSYHLGDDLNFDEIRDEVCMVAPEISMETEEELRGWVRSCKEHSWHRAVENDVMVTSEKLGIHGTIDRLLDDEPWFAIIRTSEAPDAGIYTTDRIRIACYAFCIQESLDIKTPEGLVEYIPSGISRICTPQPRDRRAALRAIKKAKRIVNGEIPGKPHNAPCENCYLKERCIGDPYKLSDML